MSRKVRSSLLATLALVAAGSAFAGDGGQVPITSDLRKWNVNEYRLWRHGFLPDDVDTTAALGPDNSVTPRNPTGVVGFDGPPGIIGDSVNSYAPLPPGAPGNEDW